MNKEYIYIDGQVVVTDEKINIKIMDYCDKIDETLHHENLLETIDNNLKQKNNNLLA